MIYMIGCLHLRHEYCARLRGFNHSGEHDEHLIANWNSVVKHKKDIVWILGDISMEDAKAYPLLNRLNGQKRVVLGNHDRYQDVPTLLRFVDYVAGVVDYKGCILSHVPVHPNEISYCKVCIHAHTHVNNIEECIVHDRYGELGTKSLTLHKYYNVDAQRLNYKPKLFDEILEEVSKNTINI